MNGYEGKKMILPKKGEELSRENIKEICEQYGLTELWGKIDNDYPIRPFKSDGCSMWFGRWGEIDLYEACFKHDLKYWCGYPDEETERLIADAELMIDVARAGAPRMAKIMFAGVQAGGHETLDRSFSWGFGRIRD